jgi:hypothetical protein
MPKTMTQHPWHSDSTHACMHIADPPAQTHGTIFPTQTPAITSCKLYLFMRGAALLSCELRWLQKTMETHYWHTQAHRQREHTRTQKRNIFSIHSGGLDQCCHHLASLFLEAAHGFALCPLFTGDRSLLVRFFSSVLSLSVNRSLPKMDLEWKKYKRKRVQAV